MRIFVTGGTGLLGNTVLRRLRDRSADDALMALVRSVPDDKVFAGVDVEMVMGELGESAAADAVDRAVASCDCVIHSAALIHIGWKRRDESMAVNRDGTETIVKACMKHDVPIVAIGTVDVMAVGHRSGPADETTPIDPHDDKIPCSYVVSKRAGIDVIRRWTPHGLRAVVVHPGFMLGPWDWKPSSGRMIREVTKTWRPIAPPGGCSVCDSRDVADGLIAAMDAVTSGQTRVGTFQNGREYILAGQNLTYFKLWKEFTDRTSTRGPIMPAGPGQLFLGMAAASLMARFSSEETDFNTAAIGLARQFHWYDSTRAKTELGYRNRDLAQTLDDAVEWICGAQASTSSQKSADF